MHLYSSATAQVLSEIKVHVYENNYFFSNHIRTFLSPNSTSVIQ